MSFRKILQIGRVVMSPTHDRENRTIA